MRVVTDEGYRGRVRVFLETDRRGDVELSYRLRRAAWGKGYATEGRLGVE